MNAAAAQIADLTAAIKADNDRAEQKVLDRIFWNSSEVMGEGCIDTNAFARAVIAKDAAALGQLILDGYAELARREAEFIDQQEAAAERRVAARGEGILEAYKRSPAYWDNDNEAA
jgi:hypothetical protein